MASIENSLHISNKLSAVANRETSAEPKPYVARDNFPKGLRGGDICDLLCCLCQCCSTIQCLSDCFDCCLNKPNQATQAAQKYAPTKPDEQGQQF